MNAHYLVLAVITASIVLLGELNIVFENIASVKRKYNPHFPHLLIVAKSPQVFQNGFVTYAGELIASPGKRLEKEIRAKRMHQPVLLPTRRSL